MVLERTLKIPTASTAVSTAVTVPLLAEIVPTAAASVPSTSASAARIFGRATVRVEPPATPTATSATAISPAAGVAVGRATSSSATAAASAAARPAGGAPLKPASGAVAASRGAAGAVATAVHMAELGFCGGAGEEHENKGEPRRTEGGGDRVRVVGQKQTVRPPPALSVSVLKRRFGKKIEIYNSQIKYLS